MQANLIILRTGILYSVIICAFISLSCFYSSFLISIKLKKTEDDAPLVVFLNMFGLYWLIAMIMNIFGWLDIEAVYKPMSFILNFVLFLQPIPLFYYYVRKHYYVILYGLFGVIFYLISLPQAMKLTAVSYWGVQAGFPLVPRLIFIFCLMAPLAAAAIYKVICCLKSQVKFLLVESITLIFVSLETLSILSDLSSWEMLLLRMFYILIGFLSYFYLSGEEATARFIGRFSPRMDSFMTRIRAMRVPFFAKLLMLFMALSVIPIALAGFLMFLTFKEIIDLYIYKPLLWNLKMSKDEFIVALGNVQIEAVFLISLAIVLVVIVSSIASRAIAQSLKRIAFGMKRIEEGDLGYKVAPESNDEIGDLANYFNKMASEVKRSREIMENWNKELEQTVADRTKNLQTLYNLSKAVQSTLNLDERLEKSLNYIPAIGPSSCIAIFLADENGVFSEKKSKGCPKLPSFKKGEGLLGSSVESEQIVKIADIREASPVERSILEPAKIKTMLLVPMENKGKKIGLIFIGSPKDYIPSNIELNLLSTIADQLAIAVENASVYEKEKEAVKRLIEIDKMKTELMSMVSHELRTPLTSIKGFLAHFMDGTTGKVNETQMKFLGIMSKEGDHLLQMIDGLLDFSRVERGVFTVKKEPLQIDKLIVGIVEGLKPQFEAKNIKLTLELTAKDRKIAGDDLKMGQVLRNLLGNAIKFVKDDPKITVYSNVRADSNVEVGIKDNGIGIDKEQLGKIFNKFYQVDSSLTRKIGGLGLGLAISKEIIEAHGGKIYAESEGAGKGSTFIFTLPMIK